MDVGNWSEVYNGNRVAFFAAARSVGLTPGFVGPNRNGYGPKVPDEPWHLFDFNDIWGAVPAFDGASPFEEEDMTPEQDTRLKNIESILGGLQNAVNDPKIGILGAANGARDKASDANRNAENAANIASEVRNWITDPNHGVLAAISQIKVGGVDSATFSEAEINRIAQVVRDLFRTDPLK
jgi:hypothetical protein